MIRQLFVCDANPIAASPTPGGSTALDSRVVETRPTVRRRTTMVRKRPRKRSAAIVGGSAAGGAAIGTLEGRCARIVEIPGGCFAPPVGNRTLPIWRPADTRLYSLKETP
jgi:hypothetical protein